MTSLSKEDIICCYSYDGCPHWWTPDQERRAIFEGWIKLHHLHTESGRFIEIEEATAKAKAYAGVNRPRQGRRDHETHEQPDYY
jgi:hypothetical protein